MTSLTLHLIVITLLAAAAITAAAEGAATRSPVQRGRGAAGGATAPSTSSTQAPTLRAPRQRRPPTTVSIDDGNGRRGSSTFTSTTPLPATPRQQRRRGTTTTSTTTTTTATTTTTVAPASAGSYVRTSGSSRGSIRAARQPRDTPTPTLGEREGSAGSAGSARNPRLQSHQALSSASSNPLAVFNASSRSGAVVGALKTPRMIQRLVAGHIHNAQGHSTYEVSAVSANSSRSIAIATTTQPTTTTTAKIPGTRTTRRKASSTYRLARPSPSPAPVAERDQDDDEALLNEPDDFDNWDNGILRLSAGSGKEEAEAASAKGHGKQSKEDAKKTLADQVRDGKYGLIEKELFRRVPKRPGVLSYARNSEVPLDNERNFGGLSEQDIWLAEDHLLVIKGGGLNEAEEGDGADAWPAIDDYDAPPRQIKLPANPVVPPPFPVQLEPHGPLQLIRDNQIEGLHTAAGNATLSAVGQHASHGQVHGAAHGPGSHPAARTGAIASAKAADPEPSYVYPTPYAPWLLFNNETPAHSPASPTPNAVLRTPLLGPWIINGLHGNGNASGPGALHGNISDFDEDDPSLYYPPAYNFVYRSNYSNPVPPGPLVPGIVLPPPPDHFSLLETTTRRPFTTSTSSTTSSTTSSSSTTTTSTTTTRAPPSRLSVKYNSIGYLPPAPRQPNKYVERVPVPVAVPIPIYPVNYQPTTPRPQPAAQLVFVPSSSSTERSLSAGERERERERSRERERDREQAPLSKSNPIYYEYFEAKRQPSSLKSNVINDFLGTKPPKRPHYKSPPSPVNDVAVVSITPKPRAQLHSEYDAALGQLIRSNLIAPPSTGRFQPPDFDRQPFLPMVNYSADEQDQDAFKAIVYQPQPQQQPQQQQLQRQRQLRVGKHQQLQLQLEPTIQPAQDQDSYLPDSLLLQRQRQLRVGKQQLQLQLQSPSPAPAHAPYDGQQGVYSTPLPATYLDNQLQPRPAKYQLRPPAPAPLQFWQRPAAPPPPAPPPAPQFKRLRHGSAKHSYPPYFVPSYPSGPGPEPLYRLLPVQQHKHWRQSNKQQQQQQQQIQVQPQPQQQYYPDRGVNIGHSLASDILVNYNSNNQFNPQAELVPQAQLGPPPLSYQAQNGGQASLWSDRPVRQSRAQLQEQA
ncbi:hormone receptor 4 [Drosophila montana]|uniref:hormone receptor 4 n=1 Tax=Drosophila montana TaxID=40370 RepID=UPI00313D472D